MFIGCDTGGTFTDFVMFCPRHPERGLQTLKLSSTPDDPGRAVLEGVERLGRGVAPEFINHATTVATNALLESQGGRVAFFVTEGFGDMLWLGRGHRQNLYALAPSRVEPPLSRQDTFEVPERIQADGSVLRELVNSGLAELVRRIDKDVQAVAVCLLHSSVNPTHELMLAEALKNDFQVYCSHQTAPGSGEYERGTTTVLAAYLSPKVRAYIQRLADNLSQSELMIVHSAGGLLTPGEAQENPHRIALSGPAAGLRGALSVGRECGQLNLVTLDMGGTSTDVALLADGELPYSWQTNLEGFPLRAPTLEIHTIGAGGGSVAYREETGLLRVGPRSAGAVPGPVCYGRGGEQPAVTDALCFNGLLPKTLGDEQLLLDREASAQALSSLGEELDLEVFQVADGVLEIAANHLAGAVRKVTTAKGYNPASFTLFPFGGAGPLLACAVAENLAMDTILVPEGAGVLSAWGALTAPWEREWSRTVPVQLRQESDSWRSLAARLRGEAEEELGDVSDCSWQVLLERRYAGQGETLVATPEVDFHELHKRRYGFSRSDCEIQTVAVRVRAQRLPLQDLQRPEPVGKTQELEPQTVRYGQREYTARVFSEVSGELKVDGPALFFKPSSTLFLAPGWTLETLPGGHHLLRRGAS